MPTRRISARPSERTSMHYGRTMPRIAPTARSTMPSCQRFSQPKRTSSSAPESCLLDACASCAKVEIARIHQHQTDGMGVKNNIVLQDYRNIVDEEGEYFRRLHLEQPYNLSGSIRSSHVALRNAYRLKVIDGIML